MPGDHISVKTLLAQEGSEAESWEEEPAAANCPAAHGVHTDAADDECCPAAHIMQRVVPFPALNEPGKHAAHASFKDPSTTLPMKPSSQRHPLG